MNVIGSLLRKISSGATIQQEEQWPTTVENINDFPRSGLLKILKKCDPITLGNCMMVCRSWHEAITEEINLENWKKAVISQKRALKNAKGRARLFVVDRRWVTLERYRTFEEMDEEIRQSRQVHLDAHAIENQRDEYETWEMEQFGYGRFSANREPPPPPPKTMETVDKMAMAESQAADTSEASWAFKFDIQQWISNYNVEEVLLQNFCSFMDRETGAMAEPITKPPSRAELTEGIPPINNALSNLHTPPHSDGNSPTHGVHDGPPPTAYHEVLERNNRSMSGGIIILDTLNEQNEEELKRISSGRVERLAEQLMKIRPMHLMFVDHYDMPNRPVLIIFYLVHLLHSNIRNLTFENITSPSAVNLHTMISFSNLESLKVVQPKNMFPGLRVTDRLLYSWLRMPMKKQKPIRMHFEGCTDITPEHYYNWCETWTNSVEVRLFQEITVDIESLNPVEFAVEEEAKRTNKPRKYYAVFDRKLDELKYRTFRFPHRHGIFMIEFSFDPERNLSVFRCVLTHETEAQILNEYYQELNAVSPTRKSSVFRKSSADTVQTRSGSMSIFRSSSAASEIYLLNSPPSLQRQAMMNSLVHQRQHELMANRVAAAQAASSSSTFDKLFGFLRI